jgi:hypothetical protein
MNAKDRGSWGDLHQEWTARSLKQEDPLMVIQRLKLILENFRLKIVAHMRGLPAHQRPPTSFSLMVHTADAPHSKAGLEYLRDHCEDVVEALQSLSSSGIRLTVQHRVEKSKHKPSPRWDTHHYTLLLSFFPEQDASFSFGDGVVSLKWPPHSLKAVSLLRGWMKPVELEFKP